MSAAVPPAPPLPTSRAGAWRLAIRLPTLPASVSPVLVGSALAVRDEAFAFLPALAALFCALALQVAANLANDVFDFQKGADRPDRLGPPRVTQLGLLTPREVRAGMLVALGVAMLLGLYLAFVGGWLIVAVGVACIVAAVAYTGGPWPYGYHALGDAGTFVFFGLVGVVGTYCVQANEVAAAAWWWAIPVGALVTAILVVNNLRDVDTDRRAGKHTLAVLVGARLTRAWFVSLVGIAYVAAVLAWPLGFAGPGALLALVSLPAAVRPVRAILAGTSGRALNLQLKASARLALAFAVAAAVGIAVD